MAREALDGHVRRHVRVRRRGRLWRPVVRALRLPVSPARRVLWVGVGVCALAEAVAWAAGRPWQWFALGTVAFLLAAVLS